MVDISDIAPISTFKQKMAVGYHFTAAYPYHDVNGNVIYYRVRLDHPDPSMFPKVIRPVYAAIGDVYRVGEPEDVKNGLKPLYNLPLIVRNSEARLWLVEGEKCADTLNALFIQNGLQKQHIAITSGSATSSYKADWSPLNGREVTIWPDNDSGGLKYANDCCTAITPLDCIVKCIDASKLDIEEGEDCVEWLANNPTATIDNLMAFQELQPEKPEMGANVICLNDIEMKAIEWLWPDRIACGKLTVIAGNPGLGKSQITASLTAIISKGLEWPDSSAPPTLDDLELNNQ